jgi:hypothetical protein
MFLRIRINRIRILVWLKYRLSQGLLIGQKRERDIMPAINGRRTAFAASTFKSFSGKVHKNS